MRVCGRWITVGISCGIAAAVSKRSFKGEVEINLQKMKKASTWDCAIKGHGELNEFDRQEAQKKMTLERFQEEHPGI